MRTPLALAVLLLLAGCSSGGATTATGALSSGSPAPTASSSAPARATGTAAPSASAGPHGAAATAPAGSASSQPAGASSSAPALAPLTTTAPGAPAANRATAAGTYTYDSSGTVTLGAGQPQDASGTATLTVSPVQDGAQHSALHSDQNDTDQDLLVRDTGTYAASLTLANRAFTKVFRPSPALLLLPDPAKVGASWSWSAVSTDGKTTAKADNQVLRNETLTIGGATVPCVVLQTHLVLSGDINYDAVVTTWYDPAHRLPVKDNNKGKGDYSGIPFSTDITDVLRSVSPA